MTLLETEKLFPINGIIYGHRGVCMCRIQTYRARTDTRLIGGGGLMVERMTGSSWIVCDVYVVVMLRAI